LVFVGQISYSLYLWHWPLIVLLHGVRGGTALPPGWSIAVIVVSVLLAWASWRFVERPFRQRDRIPRKPFFIACAAAATALLALAAGLWVLRGIPQRFTPAERAVLDAQYDFNPRRDECAMRDVSAFCRLGAKGVPASFFLWGDSHGDSAQPGFELAAQRAGASGFSTARWGCAPLIAEQSAPGCTEANQATLSWLKAHPEIRLVVLVGRWPLYESGTYETGQILARPIFLAPAAAPESQSALFGAAMTQTVRELSAMGKRVVILGDVPEIGWLVPARLSASRRFGASMPHIPFPAQVARRHAASDALIRQLGVEFIPIVPRFCESACRITDAKGVPIYSDGDHVTAAASREIYGSLMEPLLRANPPAAAVR
jgi:hypothetical protein